MRADRRTKLPNYQEASAVGEGSRGRGGHRCTAGHGGRGIRTTILDKNATRAPDLLDRDFTAPAPNQRWVADFTSVAFAETLALEGIAASIGSIGDAYDNALAETTIGLFKNEAIRDDSPFRDGPKDLARGRRRVCVGGPHLGGIPALYRR